MAQVEETGPGPLDGQPVLSFATPDELAAWLDAYHESSPGFWLRIPKRGSTRRGVAYAEALEVALCYGWIDAQMRSFDDASWLQRFTQRKARSPWSRINREKAEALIAAGRMRPAGAREVERARADGRWAAAYESQSRAVVPPDFQAALEGNPDAAAFFATLNSVNRYAILHRLEMARRPEIRARTVRTFIEMLEKGEKLYPWLGRRGANPRPGPGVPFPGDQRRAGRAAPRAAPGERG